MWRHYCSFIRSFACRLADSGFSCISSSLYPMLPSLRSFHLLESPSYEGDDAPPPAREIQNQSHAREGKASWAKLKLTADEYLRHRRTREEINCFFRTELSPNRWSRWIRMNDQAGRDEKETTYLILGAYPSGAQGIANGLVGTRVQNLYSDSSLSQFPTGDVAMCSVEAGINITR